MTMLHKIMPNGDVESAEWTGAIQYGAPPFAEMRTMLGIGDGLIEHVSVLWRGRRAHMFVDENGLANGQLPNMKATRIYCNASASRYEPALVYDDLAADPGTASPLAGALIVGPALLWEGDLE